MTKGWEILVQWKDGSTTWIKLKDMKNDHPMQTAEYVTQSKISQELAFTWWVGYVLSKWNQIIGKTKSKYWLHTHKFGIQIPKFIEEVKRLNQQNGNTLWWEVICKEMWNIQIAFEEWEGDKNQIPAVCQKVNCHVIFDLKFSHNTSALTHLLAESREYCQL